jgi:hypothetical protein
MTTYAADLLARVRREAAKCPQGATQKVALELAEEYERLNAEREEEHGVAVGGRTE